MNSDLNFKNRCLTSRARYDNIFLAFVLCLVLVESCQGTTVFSTVPGFHRPICDFATSGILCFEPN